MSELVLTPAERALFGALDELGVRYMIIGLGAALLEGASVTTQDIDIWLGSSAPWDLVGEAARSAGGFYTSGLGLQRPAIGGPGLTRIDLVLTAQGLGPFDDEYARSREYDLEGLRVRVLPVERVLASKRAANRPKDHAAIPNLEATVATRCAIEDERARAASADREERKAEAGGQEGDRTLDVASRHASDPTDPARRR